MDLNSGRKMDKERAALSEPIAALPASRPAGLRAAGRRSSRAFALVMVIAIGAVLVAVGTWGGLRAMRVRAEPAVAAAAPLDAAAVERGRSAFMGTCSLCHGPSATGVQGLGSDLVHSRFVGLLDNEHLAAFIERGRDVNDALNRSKVPMPPRGGNPALGDESIGEIVVFLRAVRGAPVGSAGQRP